MNIENTETQAKPSHAAGPADWALRLADRKMLTTLSTSDIGERVLYKILSGGWYRKHLGRVRSRLDAVRGKALRQMERSGMTIGAVPAAGLRLAPGCLFPPRQLPSTHTRLSIACFDEPAVMAFFERAPDRA